VGKRRKQIINSMNPNVGQIISNRYRVDSFVASGGMGVVYRVWDLHRNVPVAMKVLHTDLAEDHSIYRRFLREAKALEKLAHPHIVPFFGLGHTAQITFLLELFVDGPTLKDILRKRDDKRLSVLETLTYLKALCSALGYAHANGVVHCDVKPGNVIVDQGGNIYLTDFGIARHADSATTTLGLAGTPAYLAPEQIMGEPVTSETDIYALGVMLFEILTGQRPFRGHEKGMESGGSTVGERIRFEHLNLPPPDPRVFNPDVNENLAQVILKCLAKEPGMRYSNARDLLLAACTSVGINSDTIPNRVDVSNISIALSDIERDNDQDQELGMRGIDRTGNGRPQPAHWLTAFATIVLVGIIFGVLINSGTSKEPPNRDGVAIIANTEIVISSTTALISAVKLSTETATSTPPPSKTPTLNPTPSQTSTPISTWRQGQLVFVAGSAWNTALYTLNLANDGEPILLYSPVEKTLVASPSWSPDGTRIMFTQFEGNDRFTYVISAKLGESPYRLHNCMYGSWSPDNNEIVCKSSTRSSFDIIDSSNGSLNESIKMAGGATLPDWSSQNNEIVYVVINESQTSIWSTELKAGALPSLLAGASSENYAPSWSPDGKWIAYQSNQNSPLSDLWIMDNKGSNVRRVIQTESRFWSRAPTWSPDGKWLAFVSDQAGSIGADFGEIFVVSLVTGEIHQITNTGGKVYDWRVSWRK
jgi:serine/threonine protein kinase